MFIQKGDEKKIKNKNMSGEGKAWCKHERRQDWYLSIIKI
jgi:hypothetical protein